MAQSPAQSTSQPKIQFSFSKAKNISSSGNTTLVVGFGVDGDHPALIKAVRGVKELQGVSKVVVGLGEGFSGKCESVVSLLQHTEAFAGLSGYHNLVAFGVGNSKDLTPQHILSWGGKLISELRSKHLVHADIAIDTLYQAASSASSSEAPKDYAGRPLVTGVPTREEFLEKLVLGLALGSYVFDAYKPKVRVKKPLEFKIRLISSQIDGAKAAKIIERAQTLAQAVFTTRDLQTTPGGDLQPAALARRAQEVGKKHGFKVTVWDETKLKQEGMNGILAVGQGSEAPPRFIIMEHISDKKSAPTIVLVGKGVTFDTGGISIKPAAGMEDMKMDMSGAAAVIGAMQALSDLNAPFRVVGLVAAAENMPSGNATRPGDIYTAHDGQTVEVINTDAEGRLVLADALSYAKSLNPHCVIDIATLTGAVVVGLGHAASGIMGNNHELIDGYKKASEKAGEKVWELPLYEDYKDDMRSKTADYRNSGSRDAGSQKGGTFLNFFVNGAYPWIHLDVAGTAMSAKGQGSHCPHDVGTAVPMRGLVEFVMNASQYFRGSARK